MEIQHYTTKNSHGETGRLSRMTIGPDEKIWMWDKQLVWMDGSQQELPKPLSNWLVKLTKHKSIVLGKTLTLVILAAVLIIQLRIRRRRSGK